MESTESRFAHLLQPIRELTKNWEIDVASELNDYLEELDDMCITFDGGKTRLNFAEAALVIQGSACIYSKKVELLHSLVYQTLEYINDRNKKRDKQTAASQEDGGDAMASGQDAGNVAVFSPLDADVSENSQKNNSNTTVNVSPLPPESLIPPEASEKHKLPLISVTGDILFSQKDFKVNLFVPGDEDLILLTLGSAGFLLVADQQQRDRDATVVDEDDGGDAVEDFLPVEDHHMELDQDHRMEHDLDPEEHVDRHQVVSDGRTLRDRRPVEAIREMRTEETPPPVNVWTLNDPYSILGGDKPFRPGKCYKVPEGLDDGGKRKRKRPASLLDFRSWFRGTFDPPEPKLKNGPVFPDLNYIYLRTMKERLKTQRRIYRKQGLMISDDELRRTFLQPEGVGSQQQGEEPVEGDRAAELLGGDDDFSDNEQEVFPDELPAEFVGGPDFLLPDTKDNLCYEDLVKLRVEQLVVNCRGYTQETALSRRVKDWEDKIRPELVLQEQRPAFNIHDYGERIVGALSGVGQRRSFSSIVSGLDNFEVCKYLLASLQLANDRTVEVDGEDGVDGVDTMGLTLLSTLRATDRFKTLTASS